MAPIRVLLAGESWVSNSTHFKGWDFFSSTIYETGVMYLEAAVTAGGMAFKHLPGHLAGGEFPNTEEGLSAYDVVILSDIAPIRCCFIRIPGSMAGRLRIVSDYSGSG